MSASGTFPQRRLSDVCEIISGATPRRDHPEYWDGDIAWVTPKDIRDLEGSVLPDTPEKITLAGYKSCSARMLPPGSVLFSSRAPIGLVAITGREMCTNQGFKSLIPGPEVVAGYLYWCLKREGPRIAAKCSGTTFAEISRKGMEQVTIPLPPLPEQRRIAAILDKADAVRRKRQQTLDLADKFLRSAFLDLFGDPVTNPKGWPVKKLDEVCKRITDGTHQPPSWSTDGLPFLFVSNIVNGRISFETKKHISEGTWKDLTRRCPIERHDILYTTVGSYGNAALVNTERRFAFQRHIAHVKPDRDSIDPEFLVGMLQSPAVRAQADRAVRGIAQKTLNLGDLKEFKVFVPPRDVQEMYVRLRHRALEQRLSVESGLALADDLGHSLVQRAFRGGL